MDMMEAIQLRHSVRAYRDMPLADDARAKLEDLIAQCNRESGLHIQLVCNEPQAFSSRMAHYGQFRGVSNYLALVGKKQPGLEELCGYYGELIVLEAQRLGLNTCWVGLTYKKIPGAIAIASGEKLVIVIAIGYGETAGVPHKTKSATAVSNVDGASPLWFRRGVDAALLAPTAVNQQKFKLELHDGKVSARAGIGAFAKVDLGIVKRHFEIGSGKGHDIWQ
jgi:hypothetical protein